MCVLVVEVCPQLGVLVVEVYPQWVLWLLRCVDSGCSGC